MPSPANCGINSSLTLAANLPTSIAPVVALPNNPANTSLLPAIKSVNSNNGSLASRAAILSPTKL